jgi:hypothetical protein
MFCSQCGKEIGGDGSFCQHCGAKVGIISEKAQPISDKATKKPKGIIVILLYFAISGVAKIVGGVSALDEASKAAWLQPFSGDAVFKPRFKAFLALLWGGFEFFALYGLWNLKEWGRMLTLWLSMIFIILMILGIATGIITIALVKRMDTPEEVILVNMAPIILLSMVCGAIILYLKKPEVKKLFR